VGTDARERGSEGKNETEEERDEMVDKDS